jgi:hypothetical protein
VDWLPLGGPIFGASGKINLTLYDALQSMSQMSRCLGVKDTFLNRAHDLREAIISNLWNEKAGILRMSDIAVENGVCQDVNAYSATLGISPSHPNTTKVLASSDQPPLAFHNLEKWDKNKIISPYACGFAAEALFARNEGVRAVELIEKVWGSMSDPLNLNYSAGHWEAMAEDGRPIHDDTSLVHGWSTWPVFLLPQYLAGLAPLEPGWWEWKVQPILAGLDSVAVQLSTPSGNIAVYLHIREMQGTGEVILEVPRGTTAELHAPLGWKISDAPGACEMTPRESRVSIRQGGKTTIRIIRSASSSCLRRLGGPKKDMGSEDFVEEYVENLEPVTRKGSSGLVMFLKSALAICF